MLSKDPQIVSQDLDMDKMRAFETSLYIALHKLSLIGWQNPVLGYHSYLRGAVTPYIKGHMGTTDSGVKSINAATAVLRLYSCNTQLNSVSLSFVGYGSDLFVLTFVPEGMSPICEFYLLSGFLCC